MIKPEYFLEKHNIVFEQTDSVEEKMRKMIVGFGLQESYEGNDSYIFISYSHKDSALVLPAIKAVQDKGYPVWFDAGIRPGSEWAADIAIHLKNASLVLAFVSQSAFDSQNCKAEIVYAFGHRKPMLTIRLDKTPLPDGLDMQLSLSQMFDAFAYDDGDEYVRRLAAASIIPEVLEEALVEKCRKEEEAARKRREEAERRRLEEEVAQRKRQEEAERRRLEEEAAEQKYQQAKEAARQRREMEEAQQRRWDAAQQANEEVKRQRTQAQQAREEANKRKKEEAEKEKQQAAEREKQKQNMEKHYRVVQSSLNKKEMAYYAGAIKRFNTELVPCAVKGLSLESELAGYRGKLCQTIYQHACQMEKHRRSRIEASILFGVLPINYSDAHKHKKALDSKIDRVDWIWCIVLVLLHLALNVCFSLQVSYLQWPWYYAMLLLLAPSQVCYLQMLLLRKVFYVKVENTFVLMLLSFVLTLIADVFLFRFVDSFWLRILCSLGVNLLCAASNFLWGNIFVEWSLSKIK